MKKFSVLTGIPEFTKGLVRELRVRWAIEEMGLPYEEIRFPHPETKKEEYLKLQPFGQVPYFSEGSLRMFETGAILLHLALKHQKLLPKDENERAHTFTWMFAALNSIEPWMFHYFILKNEPEASEKSVSNAQAMITERLNILSKELGEKEFIGNEFTIADIILTTVIKSAQFLGPTHPNLLEYVQRHEARAAFKRALAAHERLYP
jgi:glutathione S-transferase